MTAPARAGSGLAVALAVVVVAIGALPRTLLAADALPPVLRPFVWSDALFTFSDRLNGHRLPYFEAFFEYPPLVGYLSGVFVLFGSATAYVALWAVVSAAAAGVTAWLIARSAGPARAIAFWSLSPQLLLYGAMNFDALGIVLLMSGPALSAARRPLAGLAALAVGACVKALPAVAAPFELARLARERGPGAAIRGALLFGAVVLMVALPSLLAPYPVTDSARYVAALANFDSAWGLVLGAMRAIGLGAADAVIAVVSVVGMIVTYGYVLARCPTRDPARLALLGLLAVLLWSRLYSPQYSLWAVALFALAAIPLRTFALLSIADIVVFATVYPLTLVPWSDGDPRATALFGALAAGVVLRHVALIVAWRDALRHPVGVIRGVERRTLVPHSDPRGTLREIWRRSQQPLDVRQVIVSASTAGALRGMHYHLRQSDLCFVSPGRVYMALIDLRADDPVTEEFWLGEGESLLIPPGVAHGYATTEPATVSYVMTQEADGSDEFGFRYDDPSAGIHWPLHGPLLSARDRDAGSFADARAAVQRHFSGRT